MNPVSKLIFPAIILIESCNILENSKNQIISENCDPQGRRKATLFMNPGNATLDNSIHLSVTGCNEEIDATKPGNVFVADSGHGNAKLDNTSVSCKWIAEDTLRIRYDSLLRTFNKAGRIENVYIIYETK